VVHAHIAAKNKTTPMIILNEFFIFIKFRLWKLDYYDQLFERTLINQRDAARCFNS
jgi:hypothetical protein